MFTSQRFRDDRTGEIVTRVAIHEIAHFTEYSGPLQKGDFDLTETQRKLIRLRAEYNGEAECRHQWAISEETDRAYCQQCGADGDA